MILGISYIVCGNVAWANSNDYKSSGQTSFYGVYEYPKDPSEDEQEENTDGTNNFNSSGQAILPNTGGTNGALFKLLSFILLGVLICFLLIKKEKRKIDMKRSVILFSVIFFGASVMGATKTLAAEDETAEYNTTGTINFEAGDEPTEPVDPENPEIPVDPEDPAEPGTGGALSIDYGSKFKFGKQKISTKDQMFYALPDIIKEKTEKPTYVQITDKRGTLEGWKLSLSQPTQFATKEGELLEGAQLSIKNAEIASIVDDKYKPSTVSKEITLVPGANGTVVIDAEKGTGVGTWVYRFGSDVAANKEAVQLFVPGKSVKLAQEYSTKLVWSLESTPGNPETPEEPETPED